MGKKNTTLKTTVKTYKIKLKTVTNYDLRVTTIFRLVGLGEGGEEYKLGFSTRILKDVITLLALSNQHASVKLLMNHFIGHSKPDSIKSFLGLFSDKSVREILKKSLDLPEASKRNAPKGEAS